MICVLHRHYTTATVLYCLALNFKQMSLYYSICFFFFVVVSIAKDSADVYKSFMVKENESRIAAKVLRYLYCVFKIGCLVIVTVGVNVALWLPYVMSEKGTWKLVLQRIFPVHRGLYEDKVANFWCFINNFVKVRSILSQRSLTLTSAGLTILGALPSVVMIFRCPNARTFLMSMFNISMSFFFFSYMVHEKSILLPLLPFSLLLYTYRHVYTTVMLFGLFSNFFLLRRDGCPVPYFAVMLIYGFVGYFYERSYIRNFDKSPAEPAGTSIFAWIIKLVKDSHRWITIGTVGFLTIFHIAEAIVSPPKRLPDIFLVLNVNVSFVVFAAVWVYSNVLLYVHASTSDVCDTDLIDDSGRAKAKNA